MDFIQVNELRTFNRIYREIDDLYHEIALKRDLRQRFPYLLYDCGMRRRMFAD